MGELFSKLAKKITTRFALMGIVVTVALRLGCFPSRAAAEILCADDIVPEGMAITATGTAANCAGACRARRTEAVCGPVMKICANQSIPRGYVLDSLTSIPGCQCLGSEDNGYVIRYVGDSSPYVGTQTEPDTQEEPVLLNSDSSRKTEPDQSNSDSARKVYGNPPFGNLLCKKTPPETRPNENLPDMPSSQFGRMNPNPSQPATDGGWGAPAPWWDYQQSEPFRLEQ